MRRVFTLRLLSGPYLLLATDTRHVTFASHQIFQVTKIDIVRVRTDISKVPRSQQDDDRRYVAMLSDLFNVSKLYFCTSFDLGSSQQAQAKQRGANAKLPMYKRFDPRFNWTQHVQRELVDVCESENLNVDAFVIPMILGCTHAPLPSR